MPRIAFVLWSGEKGGAEHYVAALCGHLARHAPAWEVELLCLSRAFDIRDRLPLDSPAVVREFGMRNGYDVAGMARFSSYVRRARFDVIHEHNGTPLSFHLARRAAPGARVCFTNHDSLYRRNIVVKTLEKRKYRIAAAVFFVSDRQKKKYLDFHGLEDRGAAVVPFGIDLAVLAPAADTAAARESCKFARDDFIVGYVGKFIDFKGVHKLISACAICGRTIPGLKLLLVGYGPMEKELRRITTSLNLDPIVIFRIDPPNVLDQQKCLDVLVHPSERDSCPLSVMEAMALGKAVVLNSFEGATMLVTDGVDGVICENISARRIASAVQALYNDRAKLEELGRNARKKMMEKFTADKVFARYLETYESLSSVLSRK